MVTDKLMTALDIVIDLLEQAIEENFDDKDVVLYEEGLYLISEIQDNLKLSKVLNILATEQQYYDVGTVLEC